MALSYVAYTGDGAQTDYTIPFQYIDRGDIAVYVNQVSVPFTFLNDSAVRVTTAPSAGATVRIRRLTSKASVPVNFTDGSTLLEKDLDTLGEWMLYQAQEAADVTTDLGILAGQPLDTAVAAAVQANISASNAASSAASASSASAALVAAAGSGIVGFDPGLTYPAGTVGADLLAPRPISRGGTGAATVSGALTNFGLIDITAAITVNGTISLTSAALGKCILVTDSGTPADYQVTLPTGAAAGSMIMVRIPRSATKLYTIHGGDVQIDGLTSRIMWAGESALLLREASSWTKLSGVTVPFAGGIQRLSTQTFLVSTFTQVIFTSAFGDPSGKNFCFNSGPGNLAIKRPGVYSFIGNVSMDGTSTVGAAVQAAIVRNSGSPSLSPNVLYSDKVAGASSGPVRVNLSGLFQCAAGDAIGLAGYLGAGSSLFFEYTAGVVAPTLTYQEMPSW